MWQHEAVSTWEWVVFFICILPWIPIILAVVTVCAIRDDATMGLPRVRYVLRCKGPGYGFWGL